MCFVPLTWPAALCVFMDTHHTLLDTALLSSLHFTILFSPLCGMTHYFSILPTYLRSGEHRGGRRGPHRLRELSESGDTGGIHRNPDGPYTSTPLFPSLFPSPFPLTFPYLLLSLVLHVLIAGPPIFLTSLLTTPFRLVSSDMNIYAFHIA